MQQSQGQFVTFATVLVHLALFYRGLIVSVVVQFYPWFKFSFLLFLGMLMYDNNMIMSLKQKKREFEPRIKLSHNISTYLLWPKRGKEQLADQERLAPIRDFAYNFKGQFCPLATG